VGAILVGAGAAAWLHPRLGLAVALAALAFPLGNVASGAAVAYTGLAAGWLALYWRDARSGMLFVAGPFLAPLGLLPLVPLAVQSATGAVRRGALAALAVLSAALVAGVSGDALPLTGEASSSLDVTARTSATGVVSAVWSTLAAHPVLLCATLVAAGAAALLARVRSISPFGVPAVGLVVLAGAALAGAGVASIVACVAVWGALSAAAVLRAT